MSNNFFDIVGIGFALAIGFRGFNELLNLADSFLQQRKEKKNRSGL